jgi:uncharacterized membrane protein YebE (DUF533 family)
MRVLSTALILNAFAAQARAATAPEAGSEGGGAVLALFVLVVTLAAWFGMRTMVRGMRARKTEAAVGGNFADYALEALVNAAKIDGRVNDEERRAIARAMAEIGGAGFDAQRVEAAFTSAKLTKNELVAYLGARSRAFSRDQKVALLKALLSVFVADGRFDETEHGALIDYTAAVGFDRQSAPDMLRGLGRDFTRGNIT